MKRNIFFKILLAMTAFCVVPEPGFASNRLEKAMKVKDSEEDLRQLRKEAVEELNSIRSLDGRSFARNIRGSAALREFLDVKREEYEALIEEIKILTDMINES